MRIKCLVVALALSISAGISAQEVPPAAPPAPSPNAPFVMPTPTSAPIVFGSADWTRASINSADAKATHEALEKPLAKFSVSQAPLAEALDSLARQAGLSLEVNWAPLETINVLRTQRVTLAVERATPARILQALLPQTPDLHFLVDGSHVVISTRADLESARYQMTVAYDLSFLFADVESETQAGQQLRNMVEDTIRATIAPDTWRDSGGTVGTIRFLGGQMIINQTIDNQEQIARLAAALQASAAQSLRVYDVHDIVGDTEKDRMEKIVDVIETSCGRSTWRDRGGSSSSIAVFDSKLFINASPAVHEQVEMVLGQMRKK